jgi:hypothetical protein
VLILTFLKLKLTRGLADADIGDAPAGAAWLSASALAAITANSTGPAR